MLPAKEIFSDKFRLAEIRRRRKKKKKSLPVFAGIRRDFARITVDGSPESLLMAFWEKKKFKSV
jgi:hypothetical protein